MVHYKSITELSSKAAVWVSEFTGLERVDWTTGVDYWTGVLEYWSTGA